MSQTIEYPLSVENEKIFTQYQSQFWAYYLSLNGTVEDNITRSIANAKVDLNPHQVEAALFALRSPLSHGVILADEVGLGKTIEACLVITQKWAERKRLILLIVPASLRKQWSNELYEKFSLPNIILDRVKYNEYINSHHKSPFNQKNKIFIISYEFAAKLSPELEKIDFDLVVIDEAHKLRNVYKKNQNFTAKKIRKTFVLKQKLLLTATPLQNSLMELYGLVSVIDNHFFGSEIAFKDKYCNSAEYRNELKDRLKTICYRNLRKTVQSEGSINFTKRIPLTKYFQSTPIENQLYADLVEFIHDENLQAFKPNCRHLVEITLSKLLASSPQAIFSTLKNILTRIENYQQIELLDLSDYDIIDELNEELSSLERNEANDSDIEELEVTDGYIEPEKFDIDIQNSTNLRAVNIKNDIDKIKNILEYENKITVNSKTDALLIILYEAFKKVSELGGDKKAVIFTESVKTQEYLFDYLSQNGFSSNIVMMNGSNNSAHANKIYKEWLENNKSTDNISNTKSADMKASLIDKFKHDSQIIILTEAGAEGLNLQFCSLVINYDLPWNPQRVEQRIGRCHRYGQKSDVVVVNLINQDNKADIHVFNLLSQKFLLFEGVFGCSDEVLGAIESGVDIERQIMEIYKNYRKPEEIDAAFLQLQKSLDEQIKSREIKTRQILFENFDDDIVQNLKLRHTQSDNNISNYHQTLLNFVYSVLDCKLLSSPNNILGLIYKGENYYTDWQQAESNKGHFLRIENNILVEEKINEFKKLNLPFANIEFDYDKCGKNYADIKNLKNKSGFIRIDLITISSLETIENLIPVSYSEDNECLLDKNQIFRLMQIPASILLNKVTSDVPYNKLDQLQDYARNIFLKSNDEKNYELYEEEKKKLELWAQDKIDENKINQEKLNKEIDELNKYKKSLADFKEKIEIDRKVNSLNEKKTELEQQGIEIRKHNNSEKSTILSKIEKQMQSHVSVKQLFTIKWHVK